MTSFEMFEAQKKWEIIQKLRLRYMTSFEMFEAQKSEKSSRNYG